MTSLPIALKGIRGVTINNRVFMIGKICLHLTLSTFKTQGGSKMSWSPLELGQSNSISGFHFSIYVMYPSSFNNEAVTFLISPEKFRIGQIGLGTVTAQTQ